MAKASVEIICEECGKEFTHEHICRNRNEADSYEEWARENITTCPACWYKAKRAAEEKRAEEATKDVELSELTGSEKQVAWAEKIRRAAIATVLESGRTITEQVYAVINSITDARWWIDNRFDIDYARGFEKKLVEYYRANN